MQLIDPETGTEDERELAAADVEKAVAAPDFNRKNLTELKKDTDAHQAQYGRFPKTLIFTAHDLPHVSHADQLVATPKRGAPLPFRQHNCA